MFGEAHVMRLRQRRHSFPFTCLGEFGRDCDWMHKYVSRISSLTMGAAQS